MGPQKKQGKQYECRSSLSAGKIQKPRCWRERSERRPSLSVGRRSTSLGAAVNSRIVGGRRWEQSGGDRCSDVYRRLPSLSGYGWDHRRSRAVVRVTVVALRGEEIDKSRCGCELADRRWASMGAIGLRSPIAGASAPSLNRSGYGQCHPYEGGTEKSMRGGLRTAAARAVGDGQRGQSAKHRRASAWLTTISVPSNGLLRHGIPGHRIPERYS